MTLSITARGLTKSNFVLRFCIMIKLLSQISEFLGFATEMTGNKIEITAYRDRIVKKTK